MKKYRILRSFLNLKKSNTNINNDLEEILKGLEGEKMKEKIEKLINIYITDRKIYRNKMKHETFSPNNNGIEEYKEWVKEKAIKEIKQQNPFSYSENNGGKKIKKNKKS